MTQRVIWPKGICCELSDRIKAAINNAKNVFPLRKSLIFTII